MRPTTALDRFYEEHNLAWLGLTGEGTMAWLLERVTPRFWEEVVAEGIRAKRAASRAKQRVLAVGRASQMKEVLNDRRRARNFRAEQASARRRQADIGAFRSAAARRAELVRAIEDALEHAPGQFFSTRAVAIMIADRLSQCRSADYLRKPLKLLALDGHKYYDLRLDRWRAPKKGISQ